MSLRWKVLIFVFVVSAAFAGTGYSVQHYIMLPGFQQVEQAEALDDLARCMQALQRDCEFLSSAAGDYAAWDDTYGFILDENEKYKSGNLIPETFRNLGLNVLMFIRSDGKMVWGEIRADGAEELVEAPDLIADLMRPDHLLVVHASTDAQVAGVYMTTTLGPILVGSRPITTSDRTGAVRGAVIMGRFFDADVIEELTQRTRVAMRFWPVGAVPEHERRALPHLSEPHSVWTLAERADVLHGYTTVRDVFGKPALLLRADLPRSTTQRGSAAANLAAMTSVGGGTGLMLVMWFVLAQLVVKPLTKVTTHAVRVGAEGDLSARLNMQGRDEVGVLAREFDRMVDRLAESRAQMLEIARHAGRADVATNVLHNVGNVLNSVNVSANIVSEKLRKSELPTLGLAAQMMLDHQDNLGDFVTRDERGRQLPTYLAELAKFLAAEHEAMAQEVKGLSDAIEHIRRVVDMQQVHSQNEALIEKVEPASLVEQALGLCSASFSRHGVQVVRQFDPTGPVPLDRHKVLQILVNVLSNAGHALQESGRTDRELVVRLAHFSGANGDGLRIAVADNGVGILPENLARVFAFGFSTRPGGHGIGLHSAANMAKEMGGSLMAASDGPGHGAVFTLEVPLARQEVPS